MNSQKHRRDREEEIIREVIAAAQEERQVEEQSADGRAVRIALAQFEWEQAVPSPTTKTPDRTRERRYAFVAAAGTLVVAGVAAGMLLLPAGRRSAPDVPAPAGKSPQAPAQLAQGSSTSAPAPRPEQQVRQVPSPPVLPRPAAFPLPPDVREKETSLPRVAVQQTTRRPRGLSSVAMGTPLHLQAHTPRPIPAPAVPRVASAPPIGDGGDDLEAINGGALETFAQRWTQLPSNEAARFEAELLASVQPGDDFVDVPLPQLASEKSAGAADAIRTYKEQREIVDPRLQRRVTLALKGVSFNELCAELARQTGIEITAGRRVADDNITIFCTNRPARDLMRAIARQFGFTWERRGEEDAWTYRLSQTLRAQLLEEELRARDRYEALIALDLKAQLSDNHTDLKLTSADPPTITMDVFEQRNIAIQPNGVQVASPHTDQQVTYSLSATSAEVPVNNLSYVVSFDPVWLKNVQRPSPSATSEAPRNQITLTLAQIYMEQAKMTDQLIARFVDRVSEAGTTILGVGVTPVAPSPQNAKTNAALKSAPGMDQKVSILPEPAHAALASGNTPPPADKDVVTTAEVLEAIHRATGQDVIGDHFTRLSSRSPVCVKDVALFDALCRIGDTMRLRWGREDNWLTFRSTSFFHDRPREVPRRLLQEWADSRRKQGALSLDDMLSISALTDTQLDSQPVAEGVKYLYGLREWTHVQNARLRPHWRLLSSLSSGVRTAALSPQGTNFGRLPWSMQERVMAMVPMWNEAPIERLQKYNALRFRARYVPSAQPEVSPEIKFEYTYPAPGVGHYFHLWDTNDETHGVVDERTNPTPSPAPN